MPNLLTYIDDVKEETFDVYSLNDSDILILTELGYLPFNELLTADFDVYQGLSLADLAKAYFQKYGDRPFSAMTSKNRIKLLKKVMKAKRYQDIKAFAFVDDIDRQLEKQFSALTYQLAAQTFLLAFRGTDDSLIGWKESFYMTYKEEIPAQTAAKNYLEEALTRLEGNFYLSGHSKGGSLALFAACLSPSHLQENITQILTFDAPGLHQKFTDLKGYDRLQERSKAIIPQDSVVGQLLEGPQEIFVVHSKTLGPGLFQHDTFTWQIRKRQFVQLKAVTKGSLQVNRALNLWFDQISQYQLQKSFDDSFNLLFSLDFKRLGDLSQNFPKQSLKILQSFLKMSKADQKLLLKSIGTFFLLYFKIIRDDLNFFKGNSVRETEINQKTR